MTCSADLFESTRNLKPSLMPFIPFTDSWGTHHVLAVSQSEKDAARAALGPMASGFRELWGPSDDPFLAQLLRVVYHMCDFTVVVENHVEGRPAPRPPAALTDQRNFTQHSLMALPSARDIQRAGHGYDPQYDACRLASMVYSFLVIFPFPPVERLFERLTAALQNATMDAVDIPTGPTRAGLQVWILTMGALISIGLPERSWFVAELASSLLEAGITDFQQYTDKLRTFLWHPRTSARDATELWRDVRRVSRDR
jgi:hypothetical protein